MSLSSIDNAVDGVRALDKAENTLDVAKTAMAAGTASTKWTRAGTAGKYALGTGAFIGFTALGGFDQIGSAGGKFGEGVGKGAATAAEGAGKGASFAMGPIMDLLAPLLPILIIIGVVMLAK